MYIYLKHSYALTKPPTERRIFYHHRGEAGRGGCEGGQHQQKANKPSKFSARKMGRVKVIVSHNGENFKCQFSRFITSNSRSGNISLSSRLNLCKLFAISPLPSPLLAHIHFFFLLLSSSRLKISQFEWFFFLSIFPSSSCSNERRKEKEKNY